MSVALPIIVDYCDDLLQSANIDDYCPNGLQVEAGSTVKHIISGVTASEALIQHAIKAKADTLLVHHGYFWKGEPQVLTGMKGKRIQLLMQQGISLLAYHLPLDIHPVLGNNVLWGAAMDMPSQTCNTSGLIHYHKLETAIEIQDLEQYIKQATQHQPLHLPGGPKHIRTIAWCSGGAQDFIVEAAANGADAFLSGEVSERTTHQAAELGIHYFACGHHVTETFGIKALGARLAKQFKLKCQFVDIHNPI